MWALRMFKSTVTSDSREERERKRRRRRRLLLLFALCRIFLASFWKTASGQELSGDIQYDIPNPFDGQAESFYSIESYQTIVSHNEKLTRFHVEEYFRLSDGLSYSSHTNADDPKSGFTIIGDGVNGHSYIVRDQDDSDDNIDCELDHLHTHKRVFPWLYSFEAKSAAATTKKKGKKNKQNKQPANGDNRKASFYGVGAIWLNAIERKLQSSQVGKYSPYLTTNVWVLTKEADLEVKFLFEKPNFEGGGGGQTNESNVDELKMRESIGRTKLETIQINRRNALDHNHEMGGISMMDNEEQTILVKRFNKEAQIDLKTLERLLTVCRNKAKTHRLFPSLMRAMSISPDRFYGIEYVERKYGRSSLASYDYHDPLRDFGGHSSAGNYGANYDEKLHRFVNNNEFHNEWLSLNFESQLTVYETLSDELFEQRDVSWTQMDERNDFFLKKFTEKEKKGRSSRHSTGFYHYIEKGGLVDSCKVGESEPLPRDHLQVRPIHFHRAGGVQLTGQLTGLGALILNAADKHYKEFRMTRENISILFDASDFAATKKVQAGVWQFTDSSTSRKIMFYFVADNQIASEKGQKGGHLEEYEIGHLKRIDIRDLKASNPLDDDDIIEINDKEFDLLFRYDILSLITNTNAEEIHRMFAVPKLCTQQDPKTEEPQSEEEENDGDADSMEAHFDSDDDDDFGGLSSDDEGQIHGEEFEFEPGTLIESSDFPDFFEFLDGEEGYSILSKIELFYFDEEKNEKHLGKYVYLLERVDILKGISRFSIFTSEDNYKRGQPEVEYFLNYNSETIFKITGPIRLEDCNVVSDIEPWLRVLSAKFDFYRVPDLNRHVRHETVEHEAVIESDQMCLYGAGALWRLASESEHTDFIGIKREPVDGPSGTKFKEVIWSLNDNGDNDLQFGFKFHLNVTDSSNEKESEHKEEKRRRKRRGRINSLNLESIFVNEIMQDSWETTFEKFNLQVLQFNKSSSEVDSLPMNCFNALGEALKRERGESHVHIDTKLPSFFDFVKPTNVYSMNYVVENSKAQLPSTRTTISEMYDRNSNFGKILINSEHGNSKIEVYFDGEHKQKFMYIGGPNPKCKQITALKNFIDLGDAVQTSENNNFNLEQMFGLAGLWIELSMLKGTTVTVAYEHDKFGNKIEHQIYYVTRKYSQSGLYKARYEVTIKFAKRNVLFPGKVSGAAGYRASRLELESIDFKPITSRGIPKESLHRTQITVQSSELMTNFDWNLPEECKKLQRPQTPAAGDSSTSTADPQQAGNTPSEQEQEQQRQQFPKLMDLIRVKNQFYMRSEVTSSIPLVSNARRIYLMDEWLYHDDIRVQSYERGAYMDVLIYAGSKESFDLSTPSSCNSNQLPLLPNGAAGPSRQYFDSSKVVQFWNNNETLVEELRHLYYGPTGLWRLAEKNLANVRLATTMDLVPKPSELDKLAGQSALEREMRMETWEVKSPDSIKPGWSYKLNFEKLSSGGLDGQQPLREWHVLDSVELVEAEYLGSRRQIKVDVINYSYNLTSRDRLEKFTIPEGQGCTRRQEILRELRKFSDDFVPIEANHSLWYEASLETLEKVNDDPELGALSRVKHLWPTITGTFFNARPTVELLNKDKTSASASDTDSDQDDAFRLDTSAHFMRVSRLNGSTTSTKVVFDVPSSLLVRIDRLTGVCKMKKTPWADWRLEFPADDEQSAGSRGEIGPTENIVLNADLIKKLFTEPTNRNYFPLNRYTKDGIVISNYERYFSYLKLGDNLAGPAFIVRKFGQFASLMDEQGTIVEDKSQTDSENKRIKLHNSISVKVIMASELNKRPTTVLRLSLTRGKADLPQVVDAINIAQCYNGGNQLWDREVGSYALDYPIQLINLNYAQINAEKFQIDFFGKLMKKLQVLPIQFDGMPKIKFDLNNMLMKVYFKILDAPTAIEYFLSELEATMNPQVESKAEIKLAANIRECSNWCDKVDCIALSYCLDHTCRVVTAKAMNKGRSPDHEDQVRITAELTKSVHNQDCAYHYNFLQRPKKLEKFKDQMDRIVNNANRQKDLDALNLTLGFPTQPTRFYELKKTLNFAEEDLDSSLVGNNDNYEENLVDSFKLLKSEHKFEIALLPDLIESKDPYNADAKEQGFKYKIEHANSYVECVWYCNQAGCAAMSYCKKGGSCVMIVGKGDLKALAPAMIPDGTDQCSISVRNLLKEYLRFEDTLVPTSYETQVANYSALECASLCKANGDNCLSFDHCAIESKNGETNPDAEGDRDTICYLQKMHVMMNEFDRAILLPKWYDEGRIDNDGPSIVAASNATQKTFCEHYSKSILSDFQRIPNRKFSFKQNSVIRGLNSEKCALDCQQDDECLAFEYCFNERNQPAQACYFMRSSNISLITSSEYNGWNKELEKNLTSNSKRCSIYTFKHFAERYRLDENSHSISIFDANQIIAKHGDSLRYLLVTLCYIMVSIIVGFVIQFMYIRLTGRPIYFENLNNHLN